MIFTKPVIDPVSSIDFYASNQRQVAILLPLWQALDGRRGKFFASRHLSSPDIQFTLISNKLDGFNPLVVSSYKDLNDVVLIGNERPFIMYEAEHNTETRGLLKTVSLFLCEDLRTYEFRRIMSRDVVRVNNASEAAQQILIFCKGKDINFIEKINGETVGIIYMSWGDKAFEAIKKSQATLRRLGVEYPVTVFGDFPELPTIPKTWTVIQRNEDPFDVSRAIGFQFRAGRIKPLVCLSSPYDLTLYVDADTQFQEPIAPAFDLLKDHDILVTDEILSLADLYNKQLAGWELNLLERDVTIIELDGDDQQKFVNSGVIFFRKNRKTTKLFKEWHKQWQRFQEWDEQLAFMRAMYKDHSLNVKHLGVEWNSPHLREDTIIFHNYGRGVVRGSKL